jgi:sugar phosphate isomerase/epimerase
MQLVLPGHPHLTYCTNVHPGETWPEIMQALASHLPEIKQRVLPGAAMGVGLRLSAIAAAELAEPRTLNEFKSFLTSHDLYVFTVNAFPYGPFHGQRVKEHVYEPDWRQPERLEFAKRVADILAELTPAGFESSISTVPGAFKAHLTGAEDIRRMTAAFVSCAAYLHELRRNSGRTIVLALEPEPACFLETTTEAIDFFERHLFAPPAVAQFASLADVAHADAEAALRTHLGLCFDVCHSAVAFEDPAATLAAVSRADIRIAKIQLSSALRIECADSETEAALAKFDDGIYLHQTIEKRNGALTRYLDLPDAFAALRSGHAEGEWRVHCHVPVFVNAFDGLLSTQDTLRQVLDICRTRKISPHLEVETYTWHVLPAALRCQNLNDDIARELTWVRRELGA